MHENSEQVNQGPLSKYRVLELGSLVSGPFCGSYFSDFGAEVIKVEQVDGDPVRNMGHHVGTKSLYAASMMRNKRLISVDLHTPEGQQIVRDIVCRVDIVVENFRPGVLEKWGLDYECLKELNPSLVMVRISGFGQDGPYASRPGFGAIGEAVSGLRDLNGDPDRAPPRTALPLTDYITGMYAGLGALTALLHREHTGIGQCIDVSLYESAFSFLRSEVPSYEKLGKVATRAGSKLPGHVPSNLYRTRDERYILISAPNNSLFRRLTHTMGMPKLADDPRFTTALDRVKNEETIDAMIAEWVARLDLDAIESMLIEAEVVASRIFNVADIFKDPHFHAREMLPSVADDQLGSIVLPGVVPKLSVTPGHINRAGGEIGRDTEEVLRQYTSLSSEQLASLNERGVIRQPRAPE